VLFSFTHENTVYPCALVQWFDTVGRSRDSITGMWKVRPDDQMDVVHLDCLLRGAHLLPVFGLGYLPQNFRYEYTLDAFGMYFVNHFADHHMHEIIF
ncbi:hypothetical protein CPC08DRAFT_651666, partial [Agrocybe pediades]